MEAPIPANRQFNEEICLILNSKNPAKELDVKDGRIVKKDIFSRFTSKLTGSNKPSAELKNRMTEITNELLTHTDGNIDFNAIKNNLLEKVTSESQDKKDLVIAVLCNRISSIYDRKIDQDKEMIHHLNTFKRAHLKHALMNDQDYRKAKEQKQDLIENRNLSTNPLNNTEKIALLEAKTNAKIAKTQLLYKMGEAGRSEKGVTGTALIIDFRQDGSERVIGVFKPDSSYDSLSVKISNFFRRIFGQHRLMSKQPLAQPRAENVAFEAGKFFNFLSVPPSRLANVGGKEGVFQLAAQTFVKTIENETRKTKDINLPEAEALIKSPSDEIPSTILNTQKEITDIERAAFQEFALLDFLIGNLDGHHENWFIGLADKQHDETAQDIVHIVGIDKANSFPVANPGPLGLGGGNQYLWKNTKLANEEFTDTMRKKMGELTTKKVDQFIENIKKNELYEGFFEPKMEALFYNRAEAIRRIAEIKGSTPAQLAMMVKDSDFAMGVKAKIEMTKAKE